MVNVVKTWSYIYNYANLKVRVTLADLIVGDTNTAMGVIMLNVK